MSDRTFKLITGLVIIIIGLSAGLGVYYEIKNPCVKYGERKTTFVYNSSTNTLVPYPTRSCLERKNDNIKENY